MRQPGTTKEDIVTVEDNVKIEDIVNPMFLQPSVLGIEQPSSQNHLVTSTCPQRPVPFPAPMSTVPPSTVPVTNIPPGFPSLPRPLPLTFFTVTPEQEALSAVKDIVDFCEDVLGRTFRSNPGFYNLLCDVTANGRIKAEVFKMIAASLNEKASPKQVLAAAGRTDVRIPIQNQFPPLVDLRPHNEDMKSNKTFNFLYNFNSNIFLRNCIITVVLSLTSPYAFSAVMTLVAESHAFLKILFATDNRNPWLQAFRFTVLQSCIFALDNNELYNTTAKRTTPIF